MTELEPVAWLLNAKVIDNDGVEYMTHRLALKGWPGAFAVVTLSSAQSAIAERDARIAELERERDDKAACLQEVLRHAKAEGNRYCEDEFGAPYIVNARAEAAEALLKEAKRERDEAVARANQVGEHTAKLMTAVGGAYVDALKEKP